MKIAVMGAGGVGGYCGARLAQAGEDVTFIARGKHLDAMRRHGLRVRSPAGDVTIQPARATAEPTEVGPVDFVLFGVKMYDTEAAGEAVRPLVGADTAVISLQNGVDNEEKLARILGREHVLGGVVYIFAAIADPGVIEHSSPGARLVFGELDGRITPRAERFRDACQKAGLAVEISTDIEQTLWIKFLGNCAGNGLTSVCRTPIGRIRDDPDLRDLYRACLQEVEAVGRAKGVRLAPNVIETQMAGFERLPPHLRSSTEQDLARGNRLEVASLNGLVVQYGRELGIDTPVNRFIYAALKPHLMGRRPAS